MPVKYQRPTCDAIRWCDYKLIVEFQRSFSPDMNRHVTIKEVAKVLDCSTKTVRRKVDKGLIPAIQPDGKGTHLRFDIGDVLKAVKGIIPVFEAAESQIVPPETDKLPGPEPKWKKLKQS